MEKVTKVSLIFCISILYYIYIGWAISTLWNWFLAPILDASISIQHGIGIYLLFSVVKGAILIPNDLNNNLTSASLIFTPITSVMVGYFLNINFIAG